MPAGPVIANSTPLVALWVLSRLDLLRELYGEVLIPEAVHDELLATERALRQAALDHAPWIKPVALSSPQRARVYVGLDRGEAEVLALAEEFEARLILMDERKGRRFVMHLGIPLAGTMGLLLLAKERGIIVHLAPLLVDLVDAGLFIAPALRAEVLRSAGEF